MSGIYQNTYVSGRPYGGEGGVHFHNYIIHFLKLFFNANIYLLGLSFPFNDVTLFL